MMIKAYTSTIVLYIVSTVGEASRGFYRSMASWYGSDLSNEFCHLNRSTYGTELLLYKARVRQDSHDSLGIFTNGLIFLIVITAYETNSIFQACWLVKDCAVDKMTAWFKTYYRNQGKFKTHLPASSKWPFDSPNGGHLSPEKVTAVGPKRGHFEEPGG